MPVATCLQDLDAALKLALGQTASQLETLSATEIAKLLSHSPYVPEKGVWYWLNKNELLDALKDIDNPIPLTQHAVAAFQKGVDTLKARLSKALSAGDVKKIAKLEKELEVAEKQLAAALAKYKITPPPPPLFSELADSDLAKKSTNELAQLLGKASELPEGTTLYSWLGKDELVKAIKALQDDASEAVRNAITLNAFEAKAKTLKARLDKLMSSPAAPGIGAKTAKAQALYNKALNELAEAKTKYGASALQKPLTAPLHQPAPAPSIPVATLVEPPHAVKLLGSPSQKHIAVPISANATPEQIKALEAKYGLKVQLKEWDSNDEFLKAYHITNKDLGNLWWDVHPGGPSAGPPPLASAIKVSDANPGLGQWPFTTNESLKIYGFAGDTPDEVVDAFKALVTDPAWTVKKYSTYVADDIISNASDFVNPKVFVPSKTAAEAIDDVPLPAFVVNDDFAYAWDPSPAQIEKLKTLYHVHTVTPLQPGAFASADDFLEAYTKANNAYPGTWEIHPVTVPKVALSAPPPTITQAGQEFLDALDLPDTKAFSPKWKAVFQEAGFDSPQDAGSIFYKWATDKGGFKYSKTLFTNPGYLDEQKKFLQAVASKDAKALQKFEGYVGKLHPDDAYKIPSAWGGSPAAPPPSPGLGKPPDLVPNAKAAFGDWHVLEYDDYIYIGDDTPQSVKDVIQSFKPGKPVQSLGIPNSAIPDYPPASKTLSVKWTYENKPAATTIPKDIPWVKSTFNPSKINVGKDATDADLLAVQMAHPEMSVVKATSASTDELAALLKEFPDVEGGYVPVSTVTPPPSPVAPFNIKVGFENKLKLAADATDEQKAALKEFAEAHGWTPTQFQSINQFYIDDDALEAGNAFKFHPGKGLEAYKEKAFATYGIPENMQVSKWDVVPEPKVLVDVTPPDVTPPAVPDFQTPTVTETVEKAIPYKWYGGKVKVGYDVSASDLAEIKEKFSYSTVEKFASKSSASVAADPKAKKIVLKKTVKTTPVVPTPTPPPAAHVTDWAVPHLHQAPQSPLIAGGAHAKETFVDEFGNEWMGKPVSKAGWAAKGGASDTSFLARGEDAGHRIMHKLGLEVAPSHVVEMNGKTYHVQKLFSNIKRNGLSGIRGSDLTVAQREQIMRHQVGDWLIGNHDAHEGNFLILSDDTVVSIDKGQFMKFLGKDRLDTSYMPPGNVGTPWYHGFWKDYDAGRFDVDLHAIDETLDRIDAMSDDEFRALVRPYAEGRVKARNLPSSMTTYATADDMVEAMLERKHKVRAEFDKFRRARAKAAGRKFTPTVPPKIASPHSAREAFAHRIPDTGIPVPVDRKLATDIATAKVHGVPFYVAGDQVEYGRYLLYEEYDKAGKRFLRLHAQTLPNGDRIASAALSGSNPEIAALRNSMPPLPPQPVASQFTEVQSWSAMGLQLDSYHNDIVAAAKTLAVHVSDGSYNTATLNKLQSVKDNLQYALQQLKAKNPVYIPKLGGVPNPAALPQAMDAVKAQLKQIDDIQKGVASNTKLGYQIKAPAGYVDPDGQKKLQRALVQWEQDNSNVLARRQEIEDRIAKVDTSGMITDVQIREAVVREADIHPDLTKVASNKEAKRLGNGKQYHAWDGDVEITYSGYDQAAAINWKGALEVSVPWDGSDEGVTKILRTMDKLGLPTSPASAADMKVTYHEALAGFYRGRADYDRTAMNAIESAVRIRTSPGMSAQQIGDIWQEELERALGPQPAGYWKPRLGPVASRAGAEGAEGYWPYWYRPIGKEVPADLKKAFGGKVLTHEVLSSNVSPEDIREAMRHSGVLGGKAERIRLGTLKATGISESQDLMGGGGDYVYTRWGAPGGPGNHTAFVISPRAAYRVGSQMHDHDAYGAVDHRKWAWLDLNGPSVHGPASPYGNRRMVEVDIRHGVSLWDDLEAVVVNSQNARTQMLQALRDGGYPDIIRGVPLSERVVVGSDGAKRFVSDHPTSVYSWEGTE